MAANDVADLLLRIDATTEGLRRELKKAEDAVGKSSTGMTSNVQKLEKRLEGMAKAMGVGLKVAAGMFAGAAAVVIRNTIAQEQAQAQLEATLRSTGRYTPELSANLQAYASELQSVTTFGDEAIIASQGLLLTFTQLGGEQFPRAQKAVLDVATAMGMDLKSATLQVGKALNDPILGLTALSRSGIQFSETQKQMIKDMVAAGDTAGAQTIILKELETQFGGSAEAARNTLGGALNGLKNAFGDLLEGDSGSDGVRGATKSINQLTKTLSSPEAAQAFSAFTESMVGSIKWIIETTNVIKFLTDETKAFFGVIADSDIPRLEDEIENLNKAMEINARSLLPWVRDRNIELAKKVAGLTERLEAARKGFVNTGKSAGSAADEISDTLKPVESLGEQTGKTTKELAEFNRQLDASLDRLYPGRRATRELQEEYRMLEDALKDGLIAQKDFDNWIEKNVLAEVTVTARKHVEELKEDADPFAKAWEQAMERIDTAFADAWKGAFDSFSDFADGLKNAFKQLLAEMAHAAITRPILVSLGLVGGSSGAVAGTGASGSGGLLSSLVSPIASKVTSSLAPMLSTGYFNMTNAGYDIAGMLGANITDPTALALGSLATAVAGFAGSYGGTQLGSSLTGKTANSSYGSMIGSGAGGFFGGPLGAAIGGFIGGALDSAFGSSKNRIGGVGINTGTREANLWGTQRAEYQDPMKELAAVLQGFSDAIGGSGSIMTISQGNKSPLQMNGVEFANVVELVNAAMDDIIGTAWNLAPVVKDLAKAFDGSLEATAAYAQSMQSIWQMAYQNPVRMAMQDMESANTSVMQAYQDQVAAISTLVANFDGSAGAAQNLNAALAQNQQFAYQLAVAIRQVSGQLDSMFSNSAQAIRESAMTEEERLASMQEQRRSVLQSINDLYDPAEINAAAREFDRLNNAIFEMAGRPSGQAEAFAAYAERANEVAQNQLERVLKEVERTQAEQNRDIRNGMLEAASAQQQAADTMLSAAQQMAAAIAAFNQGGGGFEVNV